jgi:mannose-6-phosphate isomerase-like protein (cupin superfamily)
MTAHPDGFLAEHALGTLTGDARDDVDRHVATCGHCAAELRALREVFATLPQALPEGAGPARVRASLLDAITPGTSDVRRFAGFRRRFALLYDLPEAAFDEVVGGLADPFRWEAAMPTVGLYHFDPGPRIVGADAGFVRFAAGSRFPMHRHVGDEYMFIFQGGLHDEVNGVRLEAGDMLVMPAGTSHDFGILPDEDCLAAVLLYGGPPEIEGFTTTRPLRDLGSRHLVLRSRHRCAKAAGRCPKNAR